MIVIFILFDSSDYKKCGTLKRQPNNWHVVITLQFPNVQFVV
jgi:hypothetical protein